MKIFTVRHGQTSWNIERRLQGHSDIPLDDTGIEQAQKIAKRLADEKIDIIYTSDLLRASKTAEAINAFHNAQIVATPKFRESSFGIYEGRHIEEIAHEIDWSHPDGGESTVEKFHRIHSFLDEITAKSHENVVIVGHYGSVLAAICYFLKIEMAHRRSFEVGNTAIHCFERDLNGNYKMIIENDTSHLL